jgi:hypothetical protein
LAPTTLSNILVGDTVAATVAATLSSTAVYGAAGGAVAFFLLLVSFIGLLVCLSKRNTSSDADLTISLSQLGSVAPVSQYGPMPAVQQGM